MFQLETHQFGMIVVKFLYFPVLAFIMVVLGKVATNANSEPATFTTLELVL